MDGFYQEGGCHCGALRYAVNAPPFATYICHCTDCQRVSGSAFNISIVFPESAVAITGPSRRIARKLGSGAIGYRWTCPECGVWIGGDPKLDAKRNIERRILRGGTFDDRRWVKPTLHMWVQSAQPWLSCQMTYPFTNGIPPETVAYFQSARDLIRPSRAGAFCIYRRCPPSGRFGNSDRPWVNGRLLKFETVSVGAVRALTRSQTVVERAALALEL